MNTETVYLPGGLEVECHSKGSINHDKIRLMALSAMKSGHINSPSKAFDNLLKEEGYDSRA